MVTSFARQHRGTAAALTLWTSLALGCTGGEGGPQAVDGTAPEAAGTGGGGRAGSDQAATAGNGASPDAPAVMDPAPDADGRDGPAATPAADASAGPDGATQMVAGDLALGAPCPGPSDDRGGCAAGLICCKPCCDGRPAVCTEPVANEAGLGVGHCPLPDLTVDVGKLAAHVGVGPMTFPDKGCAVVEKCVTGGGTRNTLHFEVNTPNVGTADLSLGPPRRTSGFEYAACHDHYHFAGYALYQLPNDSALATAASARCARRSSTSFAF
jgi:hypothetical protein